MLQNTWLEAQEDTPAMLVDRWVNIDQTILSTSDVSSIAVNLFNVDSATPTTAFLSTSFGTTCVYPSLKTDNLWKDIYGNLVDRIGYQVKLPLSATWFPRDSKHIQAEFTVTPTTGDAFPIIYKFNVVKKLYGT